MRKRQSMREKQSTLAFMVAQLIIFALGKGYEITLGDAWANSSAEEYLRNVIEARKQTGLKKPFKGLLHKKYSKHYKRLAIDLNLFKDGKWLRESEDHRPLGEFWKTLDPDASWGGDFKNKDGGHYSLGEK